jgi:hypothetical protein
MQMQQVEEMGGRNIGHVGEVKIVTEFWSESLHRAVH